MENQIVLPHISLNGTGARTLLEDYSNARDAIMKARDALVKIEFHARDYAQQENGPAIWRQAREQHEARLKKLDFISDELLVIMEHVSQFIKE